MTKSITWDTPSQIRAVRRFNRFYAQAIARMEAPMLRDYSATEIRVLYALAQQPHITAKQLIADLAIDAGYLSRLLERMVKSRLIRRTLSATDARQRHLSLSARGRKVLATLDQRANHEIGAVLARISPTRQRQLMRGLHDVRTALQSEGEAMPPFVFRPPRAGDLGWIIYRHGTVIAEEFGWDARFEYMIADILAEFARNYDPARERALVVEHDGVVVGSIFLVREDDTTAKLRVLYVEPHMRGYGLGKKLVEKAVNEARKIGYQRVVLWTNRGLDRARGIYESLGFTLIEESPHQEFTSSKMETVGQLWSLELVTQPTHA